MNFAQWHNELWRMLRLYGLPAVISRSGLKELYRKGFTPDSAYGVACDLYAGFDWQTATTSNA